MPLTIPNVLTLLRLGVIPIVLGLFYLPWPYAHQYAAALFALAAVTDWVDGWLARQLGQTSKFGAFLDPVADKLLVAVALVMLLYDHPDSVLAVVVAVIIGREITISALREWMAELGARTSVAVGWVGKIKTGFQMVAILLMLWERPTFGLPIYEIGFGLLIVAAVLTVYSMVVYLRAAWPFMKEDHPV
ncbi:CDP-diacylglycerol--glycerol-3-phosphate 3-phosphatidyltransferase [Panacagrimonas sp.]|uniref:CDP-diacylglycerol--glycerol-3-phosphate 3-phosphatidyltransferase n=1 Tax=Panacagrimonas sp. TaxID=2480088 RepID=UPI003B52F978